MVPSPPSPTILITKTFDSEVFEVPNLSRTIQSPSPFVLDPPGSPIIEEALQLTNILGNPIGPSLPPWHKAALSGAPSSNTFGPSTCSLPSSPPCWTPTPDSPIDYKAGELRVAEYKALHSSDLQFPTITPALPDPWENLCPNTNNNPHQYLAIHTLTGEEWTPYQGEIFSIPLAGFLFHHPPDFPSVLPFFATIYHHQAFSPTPTRTISTYRSLQFEGRHIFVHHQYYHFKDILHYWLRLSTFVFTPHCHDRRKDSHVSCAYHVTVSRLGTD